jgi:hypothetical protein
MDPTPLTCPKCGASWKLVKAGKGPVTCPKCKAALDGSPVRRAVPAAPATTSPSALTPADVSDIDDPGLRGGFALPKPVAEPRRPPNPLLRLLVILLLLVVLVPLAAIVLFAVVCAMIVS